MKSFFKRRATSKAKRNRVTEADMDQLYKEAPSFSEWLPWIDYDSDSQTFTLEDGISAAVMFELVGVSTEARTAEFLEDVQRHIQTCINHVIPAHDDPFVLQCYVYDEDSLSSLADDIAAYTPQYEGEGYNAHQAMTEDVVHHMQQHCQHLTQSGGLFDDTAVAGRRWQGRVRRVRLCLYRRINNTNAHTLDPVTEINQVAERLALQLKAAGIQSQRSTLDDLYGWMLAWFNPQTVTPQSDLQVQLPASTEELPYHDITSLLFLSQPVSDKDNGVWWFDGMPHRAITVDALRRKPSIGHFTAERAMGDNVSALFDQLPAGTVLSLCITLQPQDLVENQLLQVRNAAKGDTAEATATEQDAKTALAWMAQGDYLFPTVMTLFVRGETLKTLQDNVNTSNALLLASGLHPIREKDEQLPLDAYVRQLPMNYEPSRDPLLKKSRYVFSSDIAKLLPFYGRSRGTGHPGLVFFNRGGEPLTFDPLNKKDRSKNAFGLVLGPPGSGKSALMVYILMQVVATYRARIYIIEKGGSFKLFGDYCQQFGLSVNQVTLDPNTDVSLPPFADAYTMLDIEKAKVTAVDDSEHETREEEKPIRDLLGEMELKARVMITGGDPTEEARLTRADRLTIRQAIVDAATRKRRIQPQEIVLIEDVVAALHYLSNDESRSAKRQERTQDMADAMALYCSGSAGHFFNRTGNAWPEADVTVLELGVLANEGYEDQLALGFMGLMNQINGVVEREQYDSRPTFVLGDEAHLFTTNPLLAIYLVKIIKMWRKLGAWLWLATQNLADFPDEAGKLLNLMEWWIAMVCPKEEIEQIARFKQLTDEQKTLLLAARKQPGKYTEGVVLADNLQCLFRNVPPAIALALAMTEKHEKQQRADIMKALNCSELEAVFKVAKTL